MAIVTVEVNLEYAGLQGDALNELEPRKEHLKALVGPGLPFLSTNMYLDLNNKWVRNHVITLVVRFSATQQV